VEPTDADRLRRLEEAEARRAGEEAKRKAEEARREERERSDWFYWWLPGGPDRPQHFQPPDGSHMEQCAHKDCPKWFEANAGNRESNKHTPGFSGFLCQDHYCMWRSGRARGVAPSAANPMQRDDIEGGGAEVKYTAAERWARLVGLPVGTY
jgi:hypothetical protein